MVKLIATDMDGTLLDDNKNLPEDFYTLLDTLEALGIVFVIASGRSYFALEDMFGERAKRMNFLCDNGANIIMHGESIYQSTIDNATVKEIIQDCRDLGNVSPVLCGVHDIYYESSVKEQFKREINNFYINYTDVEDIYTVEDDVFKVAICDLRNPLNYSYPVLNAKYGRDYCVQVSGEYWQDIMNKGVDKGSALAVIQGKYNISVGETMAFGDFYNDIPLLERAYYSYVMANANEDMKSHGRYIADKNSENGVIKAICSNLNINL
jgi:Cof subfamily protein (haloacid dehalogenase superfamily)